MSQPRPSSPSDQFGPYELYDRLGLGGMATVHRAKKRGPQGFERAVALKRMLAHLAEDPTFVESFVREAKVASLLQHPNIAQIYDFGRIAGVYYIAMELVAGYDLRKLLRFAHRSNQPIPLGVILTILAEMCEALEYAHTFVDEQGTPLRIVHRDISPSNLIVASTGHLKVIDFGIAKAHSRQLHTESGSVKGKLGYMSPEAAIGMPVSATSDLFSMGVVAWELVTASPLFSARTDFETIRRVREMQIQPPSYRNPSCPPDLDQAILSALEREPEQRTQSAAMFREALDNIAARARIQMSPRIVAEWMTRIAEFDDPRPGSASGRPRSNTGSPPTEVSRPRMKPATQSPSVPVIPLRRSEEDIRLAAEIWGEEPAAGANGLPEGDFSMGGQVAGPSSGPIPRPSSHSAPPPTRGSVAHLVPVAHANDPTLHVSSQPHISQPHLSQAHISQPRMSQQRVSHHQHAAPPKKTSALPVVVLILLLAVAAALGTILVMRKVQKPEAPTNTAGITPIAPTVEPITPPPATAPPTPTSPATTTPTPEPPVVTTAPATPAPVVDPPKPEPDLKTEPKVEQKPDPRKKPPRTKSKVGATTNDDTDETAQAAEPTPEPIAPTPEPKPEPKPEPPPVVAKKPEPKVEPKPIKPADTRTAVVAASSVTKLSGELPQMQVTSSDTGVTAKLCINEAGSVTQAKSIKSPPEVTAALQKALLGWSYKPYVRDGKAAPACFVVSLRLVVK